MYPFPVDHITLGVLLCFANPRVNGHGQTHLLIVALTFSSGTYLGWSIEHNTGVSCPVLLSVSLLTKVIALIYIPVRGILPASFFFSLGVVFLHLQLC